MRSREGLSPTPTLKMRILCGILFRLLFLPQSVRIHEIHSPTPFASASREFERGGKALSCFDERLRRFRVPRYAGFRERRAAPFRVRAKRQLTVHELTRISRIQIEFVQICWDSWTICQGLSPPRPLPSSGLRPRPRKPSVPRAAGHERALRATRNPPRLPSRHESAPPPPSTFKMP